MQLKSWLRAIPLHVSMWHIQAYFDEFWFRINRSQFKQSIFHKTIERMVDSKPICQTQIKQILRNYYGITYHFDSFFFPFSSLKY